ncbi:hypothetical protein EK904_006258 [Melospiza melodia maxima]|nr:hypothetical protein EK904_006258 [Melospiza melodia maxima]
MDYFRKSIGQRLRRLPGCDRMPREGTEGPRCPRELRLSRASRSPPAAELTEDRSRYQFSWCALHSPIAKL